MRILVAIIVLLSLLLVGCDASSPAYVHDTPPINVSFTTPVSIKVVDSTGAAQGLLMSAENELYVNTMTMGEEVAMEGVWEGKTAKMFNVLGRRSGFTSTTILNDVKQFDNTVAAVPVMTGLENLEVVSSSVNDTNGGTGANKVKITYLDTSNNMVQSADITLNGVTPVAVAWKAHDIYWMESTSVGNLGVAAGNIRLRQAITNVEYEQITSGGNKSMSARFTVPTGYTGYLMSWSTSAVVTTGPAVTDFQDMRLRATVDSTTRAITTEVYHFQDVMYQSPSAPMAMMMLNNLSIPQLGKVKVSTLSSGTTSAFRADCSFFIALIAN